MSHPSHAREEGVSHPSHAREEGVSHPSHAREEGVSHPSHAREEGVCVRRVETTGSYPARLVATNYVLPQTSHNP